MWKHSLVAGQLEFNADFPLCNLRSVISGLNLHLVASLNSLATTARF